MKIYPNAPSNVCLEFKVWAPKLSRVTRRLFLLGSLKELGAWNIDKALKASPTKDMHVWSVEASVPAMSSFEWVWLSTNMNRGDVQWEKTTKRNRVVDNFSGTLHTIWADDDEVFLQTAACLELTTFVRVDEGFLVVLTGSTPSTGEWNLHSAKPATEFPKRSGYWKVQVAYDAMTNLDFKWAVVKEKDFGVVRVQEKMVHSVFGRKSWMRAVAPWMTSLVIVVDTSLQCDLMDSMQGRTDFIVKDRKKRLEDIKDWLTRSQGDSAAMKKLPADPERPPSVSAQTLQGQVNRKASMVNAITPSMSQLTVQMSPKMEEMEEFGRRKEDLSKSERLTQLMYKKFNQQAPVHVLQGSGQKQAPSDKMNIGDRPLGADPEVLIPYGEVVELTSAIVASSMAGTQKPRVQVLSQDHDSSEKDDQHHHRSSSGKPETSSEKDHAERKAKNAASLPENEELLPVITGRNEKLMLNTVPSQTGASGTLSDTGFTEWSSGVASAKTDVTPSESAISSSHTLIATDIFTDEDSRSEQLAPGTREQRHVRDRAVSYWETQHGELSGSWMDKALVSHEKTHEELLEQNRICMEDDYLHMTWMANTLDEQGNPGRGDWWQEPNPEFFLPAEKLPSNTPPLGKHHPGKNKTFQDLIRSCPTVAVSSPPRSLTPVETNDSVCDRFVEDFKRVPKSCPMSASTHNDVKGSSAVDYIVDFDHLYDNDVSHYANIGFDSDVEQDARRRAVAWAMEEQWGASSNAATLASSAKTWQPGNLPSWESFHEKPFVDAPDAEMVKMLVASTGQPRHRSAQYSSSQLSSLLASETDVICNREKARELERLWGEQQNTTAKMAVKGC